MTTDHCKEIKLYRIRNKPRSKAHGVATSILTSSQHWREAFDGQVVCWGDDTRRHDSKAMKNTLYHSGQATDIPNVPFRAIAAGHGFTCGVQMSGGEIRCWGKGKGNKNLPKGVAFKSISGKFHHVCGLTLRPRRERVSRRLLGTGFGAQSRKKTKRWRAWNFYCWGGYNPLQSGGADGKQKSTIRLSSNMRHSMAIGGKKFFGTPTGSMMIRSSSTLGTNG